MRGSGDGKEWEGSSGCRRLALHSHLLQLRVDLLRVLEVPDELRDEEKRTV
jgi:hypothetical protein